MSLAETVEGLLSSHASCRSFDAARPLSDDDVRGLVAVAQRAATDATGQLYSFVAVRDPALREQVATLAGDQDQVREAGAFLVVCLDVRRPRHLLEHRGEAYGMGPTVALLFGITDAALAAQTLVVAAEARGLGICYIGALQNQVLEVAELLALPEGVLPLWGLCVGHPTEGWSQAPKPRLPVDAVLHWDRYRDADEATLDACYDVMANATRSGDWVNALRKYFAEGGHMAAREATFRKLLEAQGFGLGRSGPG